MRKTTTVILACLLFVAARAWAHDQPDQPREPAGCALSALSADCRAELQKWTEAEQAWRKWMEKYGNRVVMDVSGYSVRKRPRRPDIPGWLADGCASIREAGEYDALCLQYEEVLRYDWPEHVQAPPPPPVNTVTKGAGESADIWTWILKSMHYDFGWVPANTSGRFVMLGGIHLSLAQVSDRLSLFAPGVMIVRIRDIGGKMTYKPAQTWGLSVRLRDFQFPWSRKNFSLFFNLANCRIAGMEVPEMSETDTSNSQTVMGFSFSLKK